MTAGQNYEIRLPTDAVADQYSEVFILERDGLAEQVAVHDYETIYQIPGLYERLIVEALQCVSHELMPDLLAQAVAYSEFKLVIPDAESAGLQCFRKRTNDLILVL